MRTSAKLMLGSVFVLTGAMLVWVVGYLLFVLYTLLPLPAQSVGHADAIVALTGGTNRIDEAFDLLLERRADKLLISGVHKDVTMDDLLAASSLGETKQKAIRAHCCITLDHLALSTRSNAEQARDWIEQNNVRSVILVTSNYHILRAEMEFRRMVPQIALYPHVVQPQNVKPLSNDFMILRLSRVQQVSGDRHVIRLWCRAGLAGGPYPPCFVGWGGLKMLMFVRSTLFNVLFFGLSLVFCVLLIWALVLPRKGAMPVIRGYFRGVAWLEKLVLGLHYRVEGIENVPASGPYLLASKHQSAHETMLFPIILNDPAIILKKGLMQIPLWGWYAQKAGMISVDRSGFSKALKSMTEGARAVFAQGRPIVIFPQGTRTPPHASTKDKPYKSGIVHLYNALDATVVPLALNTGFFWGRNKYLKRSGTATLKFLPPLPAGLDGREMLKQLEAVIEPESEALMRQAEAQYAAGAARRKIADGVTVLAVLVGLWGLYWSWCAGAVEKALLDMQQDMSSPVAAVTFSGVKTTGFPFAVKVSVNNLLIRSPMAEILMPGLETRAVPLPGRPVHMRTLAPISVTTLEGEPQSFTIDSLDLVAEGMVPYPWADQTGYRIRSLDLRAGVLRLQAEGAVSETVDEAANRVLYNGELYITLDGYEAYVNDLIAKGLLKPAPTTFVMNMVKMQSRNMAQQAAAEGRVLPQVPQSAILIPVRIRDNVIYAGMFRLGEFHVSAAASGVPEAQRLDELRRQDKLEREMMQEFPNARRETLPLPDNMPPMPQGPAAADAPADTGADLQSVTPHAGGDDRPYDGPPPLGGFDMPQKAAPEEDGGAFGWMSKLPGFLFGEDAAREIEAPEPPKLERIYPDREPVEVPLTPGEGRR